MFGSFRNLFVTAAVAVSLTAATPPAFAQSSGTDSAAPKKTYRQSVQERREKREEEIRERQARIKASQEANWRAAMAVKQKRAACSKRAKEQGLHLLKRRRFMKKCLAEL